MPLDVRFTSVPSSRVSRRLFSLVSTWVFGRCSRGRTGEARQTPNNTQRPSLSGPRRCPLVSWTTVGAAPHSRASPVNQCRWYWHDGTVIGDRCRHECHVGQRRTSGRRMVHSRLPHVHHVYLERGSRGRSRRTMERERVSPIKSMPANQQAPVGSARCRRRA